MAFEGSSNNALTIQSANAWFKRWYINNRMIDALLYASDPFLAMLKRKPATQTVEGEKIVLPVLIGRSPSASRDFAEAQAQAKARTGARGAWQLDTDEDYGVVRVSDKAILASKSDRGAFFRALKQEADLAIKGVRQRLCTTIFAEKDNLAGTVRSKSGSTVTLMLAHQASAFDINDKIEFRSPAGVQRAGGDYFVTKVDRAGLVLTLHKAVNNAVVANDEIYRFGDFGKTSKTGLAKWIPKTLTGLGTLNNIDRTLDPLRLAGHRLQMASNGRFDEAIRKLCSQIFMITGENPTVAVMSPLVEDLVAKEQRQQIRFDDAQGKGANMNIEAGIGGLSVKTAKGKVEIVTSAFAPVETIWLLNENDAALFYLADSGDDLVFFKKVENGGYFKVSHDAAGIEARVESFGNFCLPNPGLHGRIDLHSSDVPTIS